MMVTTSSVISYQLRDIYSVVGATGMLLHINGKFTMGILNSSLLLRSLLLSIL